MKHLSVWLLLIVFSLLLFLERSKQIEICTLWIVIVLFAILFELKEINNKLK